MWKFLISSPSNLLLYRNIPVNVRYVYGMENKAFYLFYFILFLIIFVQVTDNAGRTCLHVAAASGHYDMVQVLIGQGADLNVADKVKSYYKISWDFPFKGIAQWAANISANFRKKSKWPKWYTQVLGGNWFMTKTRSRKSRDTVPLSLCCEKCVASRHYAIVCIQLWISNDRNRVRWVRFRPLRVWKSQRE